MTPPSSYSVHRDDYKRGEVAISDADLPLANVLSNKRRSLFNRKSGANLAVHLNYDLRCTDIPHY